jgi:hypothetical protein
MSSLDRRMQPMLRLMSPLGQKRTSHRVSLRSAIPPKADIP